MRRTAAGEFRWALTLFPTHAYAAEADMSLADYEDFYYRACLCDRDDPVEAWKQQSEETRRLAEWMDGKEEIRIEGPGTDLRLNVAGRTFIAADGRHNMPDGEFFTGPVEDSASGEVTFSYPGGVRRARGGGREAALRGRAHRRRVGGAQRGVPDQDARHRRGRAAAGRARDRHELRHRPLHEGDPARREDRRDGPPGGRHVLSRDRRARTTRPSTGTWSATCARAAGSRSTASRCRSTAASRYRHGSPRTCR